MSQQIPQPKSAHTLSNGGAGATGLIAALANDYLSSLSNPASTTWVCNHSRNTPLALLAGHIDLALTYERDQEAISINEGWAISRGCIFHDHFCLAGPLDDPAGIASCSTIFEAFQKMAETRSRFLSRSDYSATMIKEHSIWKKAGLRPWEWEVEKGMDERDWWYLQKEISPAEAVWEGHGRQAYVLTDRSTLLRQMGGRFGGFEKWMKVYFEPEDERSLLMNSCHALFDSRASEEVKAETDRFVEYLLSERGQMLISEYGREGAGLPLFAAVREGYAKESLIVRGQKNGHQGSVQ